jgi:hypothetical protein
MLEGSGLEEKAANDEQDRPAEEAITSPRCASSPDLDPATMLHPKGKGGGRREGGRKVAMRRPRLHHAAPVGCLQAAVGGFSRI